jgi:HD-GYP domain-containing protein (c-di-GMP phosphodiesterase class II)
MTSVSLLQRPGMPERTERVCRKAEAIWKKPLLRQYTDHTITHSRRIIAILDKLCALLVNPLTDDETYVLLCAAFLHDIGMQQEKFYEADVVRKRYSEEEIAEAVPDRAKGEAIIRE